jgi:hypothetical protein
MLIHLSRIEYHVIVMYLFCFDIRAAKSCNEAPSKKSENTSYYIHLALDVDPNMRCYYTDLHTYMSDITWKFAMLE